MKLISHVLLRTDIYQNNICKRHISSSEKKVVYVIYIESYPIPQQSYLISCVSFSDIQAWYRNDIAIYRYGILHTCRSSLFRLRRNWNRYIRIVISFLFSHYRLLMVGAIVIAFIESTNEKIKASLNKFWSVEESEMQLWMIME